MDSEKTTLHPIEEQINQPEQQVQQAQPKRSVNEVTQNVKERYIDGIGKIHFIGGMIRFDLFSYQPPKEGTDDPQGAIIERLILSPNGFLATYDAINNMIEKLKKAGIIEQREPDQTNTVSVAEEHDIVENNDKK